MSYWLSFHYKYYIVIIIMYNKIYPFLAWQGLLNWKEKPFFFLYTHIQITYYISLCKDAIYNIIFNIYIYGRYIIYFLYNEKTLN